MPGPGGRTKKQHYVPRLHLKHFAGNQPKGMVWTYDMRAGVARPLKPMETGAQNNFYSVQRQDGSYYDELDRWLQGVEANAIPGYERLLRGEIPQGQERADFATFVASLHVRSPTMIKAAAEGYGHFVQTLVNAHWATRSLFEKNIDEYEREHGRIKISRDELWEFHNDPSRYTIQVDQKRGLPVMGASDKIQEILFDRKWYLVHAVQGFFITSDSPVYRYVPPAQRHPFYGDGGFAHRDAEVTLPLSPQITLLIMEKRLESARIPGFGEVTVSLNKMRAAMADRFLYAHRRDAEISRIAAEFKDSTYRMKVDGGGPYAEVEVLSRMR